MPPKKSKKDEPCYTRTSKAGKTYVTCEGEQKRNVKLQREISGLHGRKRKKVTKSEFKDARAGLRKIVGAPFVLQGIQVSQQHRELVIQGLRTQAAMNKSDKNIAELSSFF
tara:strand:+ start:879 stop:1211 length:333 start_codon:yes stop_codon:yes gene_type:complete